MLRFGGGPGASVRRNSAGGLTVATTITGVIGPSANADGYMDQIFRQGRTGEMIVSELHGRFYEQAARGRVFFSFCAATATTAVGTSMVGNIVWNPPGSGVNLALLAVQSSIIVTSASVTGITMAQSVQTAVPGSTTASTRTGNSNINYAGALNQSGQAIGYSVATVSTAPTAFVSVQHNTAAINTVGQGDDVWRFYEGMYVIPPGNLMCIAAVGATVASSGHTSTIIWEEVPV